MQDDASPAPRGLVSTAWLAAHLQDAGVRVLDLRYYFDDLERGQREYLESHIPGALYLNWAREISEPQGHLQMMAPSAAHFTETMQRLGIDNTSTDVGYDSEGGHYASRLWLIARRYGFEGVRILDGGWTKWTAEGRPVQAGAEAPPQPGNFEVTGEVPELIADADAVLATREQPNAVVLDVRRFTEFTGEEVRAKHGGRIPWAQWMLWQDNLDWSGNRDFRPQDEIRRRYEEAGVTPDKEIVLYCQGAVRAAHSAFALDMLGYPNVRVYDGSWEEWGSRDDLPIEKGQP